MRYSAYWIGRKNDASDQTSQGSGIGYGVTSADQIIFQHLPYFIIAVIDTQRD